MAHIDEISRFRATYPEASRLLREERLILEVTETIACQMEAQGIRKVELAERLRRSKGYVSQLLGGGSNLTLRTIANVADALSCTVSLRFEPTLSCVLKVENFSLRRSSVWEADFELNEASPSTATLAHTDLRAVS